MTPRLGPSVIVRALALIAACVVFWHAASQSIGAAEWWRPCFEQGYDSDTCMYQQYEAGPAPWHALLALWPGETVLAIIVAALAWRLHVRGLAVAAAIAVLASNAVLDYALTPAFNGGYISADDSPGFGFIGSACLAAAGVLFVVVGVLPHRPDGRSVASAPTTARSRPTPTPTTH